MAYNTDINKAAEGILYGGAAWSGTGLVFHVSEVSFVKGGEKYTVGATEITLSPADPSNPRLDVIAVNVNGTVSIITGDASANPIKPEINFETELELSFVYIGAGALVPGDISITPIYLENAGDPAEWNGVVTATGTWILNSAINPYSGSVAMEATNVFQADRVQFTTPSPIPTIDVGIVELRIRLKAPLLNHSGSRIAFYDDNIRVSDWVTFADAGINIWNTSGYQVLFIPYDKFNFSSITVNGFRIAVRGSGGYAGFYIDQVRIHTGIPINGNDFFTVTDNVSSFPVQLGNVLQYASDDSTILFDLSGGIINIAVNPDIAKIRINNLLAANGSNAINNGDHAQEWQWNTLSNKSALKISSNSTAAAGNAQRLLNLSLSGINGVSGQSTYALYAENLHSGSGSINVGGSFTALNGDSNYGAVGAVITGYGLYGSATNGVGVYGGSVTEKGVHGVSGNVAVFAEVTGTGALPIGTRCLVPAGQVEASLDLWADPAVPGTNGTGTSITFSILSSTSSKEVAGAIDVLWTTATHGSRTSAINFYAANNAVLERKMRIAGNGQITADQYGVGTFVSAHAFLAGFAADGEIVEVASEGIPTRINYLLGAVATNSINNANYSQEWQWNTLTTGPGLKLYSSSTLTQENQKLLEVVLDGENTSLDGESDPTYSYAGYFENKHTGIGINVGVIGKGSGGFGATGVVGVGESVGVNGSTSLDGGIGVYGSAGLNGIGIQGLAANNAAFVGVEGIGLQSSVIPIRARCVNAISGVHTGIQIMIGSGSENAGDGGSLDWSISDSNGNQRAAGKVSVLWESASQASYRSSMEFATANNAVLERKMKIAGNGQITVDKYGVGTFVSAHAFLAGFATDGKIVEVNPASANDPIVSVINYGATPVVNLTAITSGHRVYVADCSAGSIQFNFPDATTSSAMITIKKTDNSVNGPILDGFSTQTIDGSETFQFTIENDSYTLVSDGSNWKIISSYMSAGGS